MDPFATLGIEPTMMLDLAALEKRHRDLSRALHPDRFAQAGTTERRIALGKTAELNEAWRIVRDPVKRAEALFRRAGVEVGEDREPKPSPALLTEVMELRECLSEARRKKDRAELGRLKAEVESRARGCEAKLASGFAAKHGAIDALVPVLGELRFHRRFLEEVAAIEDELEGIR
jgi:molecular chaperone HscB